MFVFDKAGRQIDHIKVPEAWVGNLCFGGPDKHTLFLAACKGLYSIRLTTTGANPGEIAGEAGTPAAFRKAAADNSGLNPRLKLRFIACQMQNLIAKATTLLEALPYIQKFSGATFVVKYGGSFMDSSDPEVRTAWRATSSFLKRSKMNPVVVHGGGKAITRAMEKAGLKARFIQGQRVTDAAAVKIVDQVLSREINPAVGLRHQNVRRRGKRVRRLRIFSSAGKSSCPARTAARSTRLRGRGDRT